MYILGLSGFERESAVVLLRDEEILAAAQEERFTRKKGDSSFPSNALNFCLARGRIHLSDIDLVAFCGSAKTDRRHALSSGYFLDDAALGKRVEDELYKIDSMAHLPRILVVSDLFALGGSAFFPSPYEESAIIVIDGFSSLAKAAVAHGRAGNFAIIRESGFPDTPGVFYSAFTEFLGFGAGGGEFIFMGLAPYGDEYSDDFRRFYKNITEVLIDISDDGLIHINPDFLNMQKPGGPIFLVEKVEKLMGIGARQSSIYDWDHTYCNLALAVQRIFEEVLLKTARWALKSTASHRLCLAGNMALNCAANRILAESKLFDDIWIQPASGDAGAALGAAYCALYAFGGKNRSVCRTDRMQGAFLGPEFSNKDIEKVLCLSGYRYEKIGSQDALCARVAEDLACGRIVGWFQGRMEWGPRALGNRSILCDPRDPQMAARLNHRIKSREPFRPFAPSITEEDAQRYFGNAKLSPYMLLTAGIVQEMRKQLPPDYSALEWKDKMAVVLSDIPAVTHTDYSARVQTVSRETSPLFWKLLKAFESRTGVPVLLNTSFNTGGEPIVCTPQDALSVFEKTALDCLVMGQFIVERRGKTT